IQPVLRRAAHSTLYAHLVNARLQIKNANLLMISAPPVSILALPGNSVTPADTTSVTSIDEYTVSDRSIDDTMGDARRMRSLIRTPSI
ncbi:hypothetical protein, partial [Pseudomonas saliphila]|uniref:hypothetical protein n=1 Tax=Pseudomonas saliphila TaxID=2586906 RepID=UPI0019D5E375